MKIILANSKEYLALYLKEKGVPCELEKSYKQNEAGDFIEAPDQARKYIFSFPVKTAEGAIVSADISAIQHLEIWRSYSNHYTDHNPSVTIYVKDNEWDDVGKWVWDNWKDVCGITFLPASNGHKYEQAPLEEITKNQYDKLMSALPDIDFADLEEDFFDSDIQSECASGFCEMRLSPV